MIREFVSSVNNFVLTSSHLYFGKITVKESHFLFLCVQVKIPLKIAPGFLTGFVTHLLFHPIAVLAVWGAAWRVAQPVVPAALVPDDLHIRRGRGHLASELFTSS
jgi:hypothetical protein